MNFSNKSVFIKDIKVHAFNSKEEILTVMESINKIFIAINAEKILKASDKEKNIINQHIGYPDGIGAVWALHRKGYSKAVKIPGCELWLDLIDKVHDYKKFYFIGATEHVIQNTITRLKKDFPNINIVGYRNGYFRDKQEKELISDVQEKKPDIIFVAMGSPKQEIFMKMLYDNYKASYLGLGGSFDIYVGNVDRAPNWWIKNNLEWAYRLYKQPKRILRQYVYVEFFIRLIFNRL